MRRMWLGREIVVTGRPPLLNLPLNNKEGKIFNINIENSITENIGRLV